MVEFMTTIYGRINTVSENECEAEKLAAEVLVRLGITDSETKTYKYEKTYVELKNHYMTDFKTVSELLSYKEVLRSLDSYTEGRVDEDLPHEHFTIVDSRRFKIGIENVFWILVGSYDELLE